MKIVFMGSSEFSRIILENLIRNNACILCVYTQAPKPSGRGKLLTKTLVQQYAEGLDIEVRCPSKLRDQGVLEHFSALHCDVAVVASYGLIIPADFLVVPRFGFINVHPSDLPFFRGAAPIQRTILNGDTKTASCIMQMDTGLDTGDVLKRTEVDISHRPMFLELHNQLAEIGAKDLLAVLSNIHDIKPVTQQSEYATYAHKINKEEGNIYASDMLEVVERKYRAFHLWPGLRINLANEEVKLCEVQFEFTNIEPNVPGSIIWGKRHFKIALSGGYLVPQVLQRPGKKQISVESFVNGMRQECKELEMLDCLNNGYKNI